MSKTIIKKPTYEMRCHICKALFSFEVEDTTTYSSQRYWFDTSIECPCCKCKTPCCKCKTPIRDDNGNLLPKVKVKY